MNARSALFSGLFVLLCVFRGYSAGPVRLTRDGSFKQHLCWSPDGKRFLLTRLHRGKMGLWAMNADGSGLKPFLAPAPDTPHFDGHWSPDGRRVVYVHV